MLTALVIGVVLLLMLLAASSANGRRSLLSAAMGVMVDDVRVTAPDGTALATTVLRPWWRLGRMPTILIRTPYGRGDTGRGYARRGFAVVVQDMRGRHDSGGVFQPYTNDTQDGSATLDWIAAQPWSNGRVGTLGCSASGESQLVLARARHPALRAMIAEGAGGGVGSAMGRFGYFGVYEGGIFQLASAAGWFARSGEKTPEAQRHRAEGARVAELIGTLPVDTIVSRLRPDPTDFELIRTTPLGDPAWERLGYLADHDRFTAPSLHINGWYDQGVVETLAAAELMRRNADSPAAQRQHVIIGPRLHCQDPGGPSGTVGDVAIERADEGFGDVYLRWMKGWLEESGQVPDLPRYQAFVLQENAWIRSETWPPAGVVVEKRYLSSGGRANSRAGDGSLLGAAPGEPARQDEFSADPSRPVPTRGGAFCCTGDPAAREGPVDQVDVESRDDVLVYTSEPLREPLRIVGSAELHLTVSTSTPDADLVVKLVDVEPGGRALNIQSGALRLRYRDGILTPQPMEPGRPTTVRVRVKDIAYLLRPGHRLRVQIAGSDFPRLERNLNTGGRNHDETVGRIAAVRVHHGGQVEARLDLPVLPGPLAASR